MADPPPYNPDYDQTASDDRDDTSHHDSFKHQDEDTDHQFTEKKSKRKFKMPNVLGKVAGGLNKVDEIDSVMKRGMEALKATSTSDEKDVSVPVHTALAHSYGRLGKASIIQMDNKLKVMIAVVIEELKRLEDLSWDNVVAAMMTNGVCIPRDRTMLVKNKRLLKEKTSYFKIDGSPNPRTVDEVKSFFTDTIADADVLADTKVDIEFFARIVAQTGASIDSFFSLFTKKTHFQRTMVDVGVLRYPDITRPFFKLYRIFIKAWADCRRILFVQHDANGVEVEFRKMIFDPREDMIKDIKGQVRKKALSEISDLFAPKKT